MSEPTASPGTASDPGGVFLDFEQDQISQNIAVVMNLYT
jgi:hypothetical protein